jgi:hypothetical protein
MKFYKIDLLTLLISLFLFASCKSSNTIGLDVDPINAIQGELVDTITVSTQTLLDEPASTGGLIRYPLGYLTDPVLGTTESSLAMSVNLPSSAYWTLRCWFYLIRRNFMVTLLPLTALMCIS